MVPYGHVPHTAASAKRSASGVRVDSGADGQEPTSALAPQHMTMDQIYLRASSEMRSASQARRLGQTLPQASQARSLGQTLPQISHLTGVQGVMTVLSLPRMACSPACPPPVLLSDKNRGVGRNLQWSSPRSLAGARTSPAPCSASSSASGQRKSSPVPRSSVGRVAAVVNTRRSALAGVTAGTWSSALLCTSLTQQACSIASCKMNASPYSPFPGAYKSLCCKERKDSILIVRTDSSPVVVQRRLVCSSQSLTVDKVKDGASP
eukprot:1031575-Rhodomonas_salina.4